MIKRIFLLIILFFITNLSFGQCPTDYVDITSQAQLNALVTNFPNCTEMSFGLGIHGGSITDLTPLSQFTSMSNQLNVFDNPNLISLDGLQNMVFQPNSWVFFDNNEQLASFEFVGAAISFGFNLDIGNHPMISDLTSLPDFINLRRLIINGTTSLTDLSGLENISLITHGIRIRDNTNLINLTGLNVDFGNGEILFPSIEIQNNTVLNSIDGFLLSTFDNEASISLIDNPSLTSCAGLESVTDVAFFFVNNCDALINFEGLENITNMGTLSILNNDALVNFAGLQGIILEVNSGSGAYRVEVSNNPLLTSMSNFMMSSTVISDIIIQNNPLLTTLEGLEGVSEIIRSIIITDNSSLVNLNALNNGVIETGFTRELNISANPVLTDITGIENYDFSNFNENSEIFIENNTALSTCNVTSICNVLAANEIATISIQNNNIYCTSVIDVINECGIDSNVITGSVQFDFNNDGCDSNDFNVQSVLVETTDGITTIGSFTNNSGTYQHILDVEGDVTTTVVPASLPDVFVVTPGSVETTFVGFGNEEIIDFCLTTTGFVDNLELTLVPLDEAVPGFNGDYQLIYENRGTFIEEGEVTFEFDTIRQNFVDATPAPTSIIGNIVTFDFENLLPFESRVINVRLNHFGAPINQIGDRTIFDALVEDEGDESPINNRAVIEQIYVGSFDPNDIQVVQGPEILEEQTGDFLDFIVRFQNTGTADAITVRVDHILDDNLDFETLRPLSSSHPYRATIINGNEVSFLFEDINLPPEELDEEGSQGFVIFQARPKDSFSLGDSVAATASIFFDFNEPIITNTVTTTVVDVLSVEGERFRESDIKVYPNPVSDVLTIEIDPNILYVKTIVYSLLGEKLIETNGTTINFSSLSTGVYFVEVFTDTESSTKKIIKK